MHYSASWTFAKTDPENIQFNSENQQFQWFIWGACAWSGCCLHSINHAALPNI
jgi:hypothetical protein